MAQFTEEFVPMNDLLLPSSFALTTGAGSRLSYWLRTAKTAQCKVVAEFGLPCIRRSQGTKRHRCDDSGFCPAASGDLRQPGV